MDNGSKATSFEMAMAEQTLLSESGGSPIGTKRVAYREAIEAARSKTVADTSGEAERASGSKRARSRVVFCLFVVVHRLEM